MPRVIAALALLCAAGCGGNEAPASSTETNASGSRGACAAEMFEGSRFTYCAAHRDRYGIETVLTGPDGAPLRSLSRLGEQPGAETIVFATNGGMFDQNGLPIGLYVEEGEERRALNRKRGPGNFHLLPNGVFWVDAQGWHVATTDDYAAASRRPSAATQSGPMLLIDGQLHPKIAANGSSHYIRNAVGVDANGSAQFVISDDAVSFGRLARYMRDRRGCTNALYLDGSVSALWDPAGGRLDEGPRLGPLIVVRATRR